MRKLVSLLLLIMISCHALGDVFTVTSNTATGNGSLAYAIQQASLNGSSTKDIIQFNLPYANRSDRTIVLSVPLPLLSSNLIIDGSTQPGAAFGVSGAKVEIDYTYNGHDSDLFRATNNSYIEIYGLYLKGAGGALYAVRFSAVSHIVFGAAGKGNLVNGFVHALYSKENNTESRDFIIRGNLFGTTEGGDDAGSDIVSNAVDLTNVKDILLGGEKAGEGNTLCGKINTVNISYNTRGTPGYFTMQNNKVGTDAGGLHKINAAAGGTVNIFGVNENDYDNGLQTGTTRLRINVINNVIASRINLFKIRDTFFFKSNHFGVADDNVTNIGSQFTSALFIQECGEGVIGGSEEDRNYFANSQTAILEAYTGSVTVTHNSFRCNTAVAISLYVWSYNRPQPFIYVTSRSRSSIAGKALPNSTIDVYENDDCSIICEGKKYITSVKADDAGNWQCTGYAGKDGVDVIATATDTYGATSEFSKATINDSKVKIVNATCGKNNGSVMGIQILSGTSWHWEDESGATAGNDSSLRNVKPGKYRMVVDIGTTTCSFKSKYYTVGNTAFPQSEPQVTITNVNCGQASGSLSMVPLSSLAASWFMNGNILADTGYTVTGLLPAKYYLKLSSASDTSCYQVYSPYEVMNLSGGSLDVSGIVITNSDCNRSIGSISYINYTPSLVYWKWEDDKGNTIATGSPDLKGVPAGSYRLKAKSNDNCDTIVTNFFTIRNANEISIDSSGKQVAGSSRCASSGAIIGMLASNAETYTWHDESGKVVGNNADINDLHGGDYILTVSNSHQCSATSLPVHVPLEINSDWQNINTDVKPSDCSAANGYIHITGLGNAPAYQYHWLDANSAVAGTSLDLDPAGIGSYTLLATDGSGCTDTVVRAVVASSSPSPVIREENVQVKNETCHGKNGSITGIVVDGGTKPVNWVWKDGIQSLLNTSIEIRDLSQGIYYLVAKDAAGCTDSSREFNIGNNTVVYQLPVYKDMLVQRHSAATVTPVNFQEGTYSLSDGAAPQLPALQNTTGVFTTGILDEDKTFYISVSIGICTSGVAVVHIRMADETKVSVPGGFTPNGDGINDRLRMIVTGIFLLDDFIVYDRLGHVVFRTKDAGRGWDGTRAEMPLNTGTYIWLIRGKDGNGKPFTAKGTTVLIR